MKMGHRLSRFLGLIASMAVAFVLLFTGVCHATEPYFFMNTISSYRILPSVVVGIIGLWLPYLQIVVALCIGFRFVEATATKIAACLYLLFIVAQASVLLRGFEIDCGCFGYVRSTVSLTSIAIPMMLFFACVAALWFGATAVGGREGVPIVD